MKEIKIVPTSALLGRNKAVTKQPWFASPAFSGACLEDPEKPERHNAWLCTLDDVATELGVSREQAKKIEQRALRKCRAFCEARGFHMEDLVGT